MTKLLIIKENKEKILNRAKKYQNNKERLWKQARNKYSELSNKEKCKKENMGEIDVTVDKQCINKNSFHMKPLYA